MRQVNGELYHSSKPCTEHTVWGWAYSLTLCSVWLWHRDDRQRGLTATLTGLPSLLVR